MGKLVNFCAGADLNILPAKKIDALLVNVPDHGASQRKIEKAQKMFELSKPEHVILDSGGFQLLMAEKKSRQITFDRNLPAKHTSHEINLTPKHVMEAAATLNPEIVVGLDFPIGKIKEHVERQIEFIKKLEYNVPWAFESVQWHKKLCSEAKFFLPVQCYDLEQLDIFFSRINGLYFDGVSMPIRGLKIWEIALFMTRFYQLGIGRVHLLGTSGFLTIALGAWMARHLFDWVSLDATSWRIAAEHAEFINALDLSREPLKSEEIIDKSVRNDCLCPFCDGLSFNHIKHMPFKDRVEILRGHNWWAIDKAFKDLYENSTGLTRFAGFLKKRCKRRSDINVLCSVLSLCDALKDVDIAELENVLTAVMRDIKNDRNRQLFTPPLQYVPV